MYDKLRARELMAIPSGKLKRRTQRRVLTFNHAALLGPEAPGTDDE
jgi:hypothetical protein